jgi:LysR family transcriptional regulator, nitrogen assimilation regulatory protein
VSRVGRRRSSLGYRAVAGPIHSTYGPILRNMKATTVSVAGLFPESPMSLDTRSLKYFVRVAEVGSISRAAKALHIAQPALSTSLSNLEEYLRVKLFLRSAQGVTLTSEGQRLLAHAHRILEQIALAEQELRSYGEAFCGPPVTVGLIHSVARIVVPLLYGRLKADYPELGLRIVTGHSAEMLEGLLSGDVDCAVLPESANPDRVNVTELFGESMYLLGDRRAPGLDAETIPFEQAVRFPLLSAAAPSWARSSLYDMAVARGLHVNVGLETDLGQVSPMLLVNGELFMSGYEHALKGVRIVEPEIRRTLYLATLKSRSLPPSVQAVCDVLAAILREQCDAGVFR